MTVQDAILQSLSRAGDYNRDDQVAPAVILWSDKERQWEPVLPVLRGVIYRVIRGGSWFHSPPRCRTAYRGYGDPSGHDGSIGFRVALVAQPSVAGP